MEPLEPWRIAAQVAAAPLLLAYCLARRRADLLIIAACVVAMAGYGVLQDQVSVRLCREYFTVGHPPIEGLEDPTLLGAAWGFLGGWWGGLLMGVPLGLTATLGRAPKLSAREVLPGVGWLLLAVAAGTLLAGFSAWHNGGVAQVRLGGGFASAVPKERHRAFLAVACAHLGTYLTAAFGSAVLCLWAARLRRRKAAEAEVLPPPDRPDAGRLAVGPWGREGRPQLGVGVEGAAVASAFPNPPGKAATPPVSPAALIAD